MIMNDSSIDPGLSYQPRFPKKHFNQSLRNGDEAQRGNQKSITCWRTNRSGWNLRDCNKGAGRLGI